MIVIYKYMYICVHRSILYKYNVNASQQIMHTQWDTVKYKFFYRLIYWLYARNFLKPQTPSLLSFKHKDWRRKKNANTFHRSYKCKINAVLQDEEE